MTRTLDIAVLPAEAAAMDADCYVVVDVLRANGQSVITATELGHVPGADEAGVTRVAIAEGRVLQAADDRAEGPVPVATDGDRRTHPHPPGRMKARGLSA